MFRDYDDDDCLEKYEQCVFRDLCDDYKVDDYIDGCYGCPYFSPLGDDNIDFYYGYVDELDIVKNI